MAVASLAIAMWKIQSDNKKGIQTRAIEQVKEFQILTDKVMMNEVSIENMREQLHREVSQNYEIYRKEQENIKRVWEVNISNTMARIEKIEKEKDDDVKTLSSAIINSNREIAAVEIKHHGEVIGKIESLTVQLTDMCSTFKEYRRTRNGNSKNANNNDV